MRHAASILFGAWLVCGVPGSRAAGSSELGRANANALPAGTLPQDVVVDAIGQLPDGRMLFGTSQNVLLYDGRTTEVLPLPEPQASIGQVSGTPQGEILIAASSLMALGRQEATGTWKLHPLREPGSSNMAWREPYQVFFAGSDPVVINAESSGWRHDGNWITWPIFGPQDGRYFRHDDDQLMRIEDGRTLARWTQPDWTPDRTLSETIGNGILQATVRPGNRLLFIMEDGRFLDIDPDGTVHPRPTPAGLISPVLRGASVLPHGGFVTLSEDSNLSVIDASLTAAARISPDTGLPPGTVRSFFVDREGGIWSTVSGQVARIEHPEHVTRYDRFNGLETPAVSAIARHQGRLYVGTSGGVYRLEPGQAADEPARFQGLRGPRKNTPALLSHQDELFVGATDGVYRLNGDTLEPLAGSPGQVLYLTPSAQNPNHIYFGATGGIGRLQRNGRQWTPLDVSPNSSGTRGIVESGPSEWWLLRPQGIDRYTPAKPRPVPVATDATGALDIGLVQMNLPLFGQNVAYESQPELNAWLQGDRQPRIVPWGDTPLIVSARGLRSLDESPWPLDPATQAELAQDRRLRVFAPLDAERAWVALSPGGAAAQNGLGHQVREIRRHAAAPLRILPASATAIGDILALLPESGPSGPVLWVGGDNGLLRIELDGLPPPVAPTAPRLRPTGDLALQAADQPLPADYDQLGFTFSAPDYSTNGHVVYRSRLVVDGTGAWSAYGAQPHRDLGHLDFGSYRFEVQARSRDGLLSPVSAFNFQVAPPWWFSWWGGLLAVATAAGLVLVGVRWAVRRSRTRERQLEALVAERTTTLRANERQLSLAKTEAEAAQAEAEHANRAKSAFLAAMSHELRTPLNAILGFAQILHREDSLSAKGRSHLEVIDRNGQHLLTMINEVLDLSKIEAGRLNLHPVPCSLHTLAQELAEMFEPRAQEKGLAFRIDIDPDLPPVMADAPKLRQVLINLLANAVKFTVTGEIVVAIQSTGSRIRFAVSDTGIGIPNTDRETVFAPFHQMPTNADADATGTGLGLPISQRLIELMGGRITVDSEPGQGSLFQFELNLPPAAEPPGRLPESVRVVGYEGRRRHVLVIDDVVHNRALLRELLSAVGFDITESASGEDALDAQRTRPVDLVLLDLRLPGISGRALTNALRAQADCPLPIVAVSASVLDMDRDRTAEYGCDDFVAKPIEEALLFAAIGRHLDLRWVTTSAPRATSGNPFDLLVPAAEIPGLPLPAVELLQSWLELARRSNQRRLREALDAEAATGPDAAFRRALDQRLQRFRTGEVTDILVAALQRSISPPDQST